MKNIKDKWNEGDLEKIIFYKRISGKNQCVAIVDYKNKIPNTIQVVDYPLKKNQVPYLIGVPKNQEKENKSLLEQPGDWYFIKNLNWLEETSLAFWKISKDFNKFLKTNQNY